MVCAASAMVPPIHPLGNSQSMPRSNNIEIDAQRSKPDFTIEIPNGCILRCHKRVLCGRWPYMRKLISSGLKESQESHVVLTDDWTPLRLKNFVRYIYLNEVTQFESLEDCEWLLAIAPLYGLVDFDHLSAKEFVRLVQHCHDKVGNFAPLSQI
jgi:hypothetical protein